MAEKPSQTSPEPSIGRIVTYRNVAGVDMPAIITALTDDRDYVHLQLFVPPGHQPDVLSYQYGTPRVEADEPDALLVGCWRWPERKAEPAFKVPTPASEPEMLGRERTPPKRSKVDDPRA